MFAQLTHTESKNEEKHTVDHVQQKSHETNFLKDHQIVLLKKREDCKYLLNSVALDNQVFLAVLSTILGQT